MTLHKYGSRRFRFLNTTYVWFKRVSVLRHNISMVQKGSVSLTLISKVQEGSGSLTIHKYGSRRFGFFDAA